MSLLLSFGRRARALHNALRPLSTAYGSQWERDWAGISIGNQRFSSAAAARGTAIEAEDARPHPPAKRPGLDHAGIIHTAERIFGSTLAVPVDFESASEATPLSTSTEGAINTPLISKEAAHDFEEIIASVDKKRRKAPIRNQSEVSFFLYVLICQ